MSKENEQDFLDTIVGEESTHRADMDVPLDRDIDECKVQDLSQACLPLSHGHESHGDPRQGLDGNRTSCDQADHDPEGRQAENRGPDSHEGG
jgi:hypothetical protein